MTKKSSTRTSNDQRSNSMNPNNQAHQAGKDNRSRQLNPEHPTYHKSRSK